MNVIKIITKKNINKFISHIAPSIELVGYRQKKKGIKSFGDLCSDFGGNIKFVLGKKKKYKKINIRNCKTVIENLNHKHKTFRNTNTVYIDPLNSLRFVLNKLKKDKALKRIESGEKEIKRAKDVLREIKKQIDPLRKQAEQAQLHKELSEVLKFNKTKLNILQYRNFNKKYDDIKSQLEEVNRFINDLESKLEDFKVSKNKLRRNNI